MIEHPQSRWGTRGFALTLLILASIAGPVSAAQSAVPPVVLSGSTVDGAGNPVVGADVYLYVLNDNGSAGENAIATTQSDSHGNWSLTAPDTQGAQAAAAQNGGYVNFEVDVMGNGVQYASFFSKEWVNGAWVDGNATPVSGLKARLALGTAGVARLPARRSRLVTAVDPPPQCSKTYTPITAEQTDLTTMGELHSAAGEAEDFTYGKTADSDIGVGFSSGGSGWSINGTVHVGNSLSTSVTAHIGADEGHREDTQMGFKKYDVTWTPSWCAAESTQIRSTGWNGGRYTGTDNHSLDHQCGTYPAANVQNYQGVGSWMRDSGSMVTFSGAVSAFGVSLTAQSGWSSHVQSNFIQTAGGNHYYCGSNGSTLDANRVFAGL